MSNALAASDINEDGKLGAKVDIACARSDSDSEINQQLNDMFRHALTGELGRELLRMIKKYRERSIP